MKLKVLAVTLLVSLAGCSKVTNPFQNRSGEYLKSKENVALIGEKNLQIKSKSPIYIIPNGDSVSIMDDSLTLSPTV